MTVPGWREDRLRDRRMAGGGRIAGIGKGTEL
jgi:hypothetical protein